MLIAAAEPCCLRRARQAASRLLRGGRGEEERRTRAPQGLHRTARAEPAGARGDRNLEALIARCSPQARGARRAARVEPGEGWRPSGGWGKRALRWKLCPQRVDVAAARRGAGGEAGRRRPPPSAVRGVAPPLCSTSGALGTPTPKETCDWLAVVHNPWCTTAGGHAAHRAPRSHPISDDGPDGEDQHEGEEQDEEDEEEEEWEDERGFAQLDGGFGYGYGGAGQGGVEEDDEVEEVQPGSQRGRKRARGHHQHQAPAPPPPGEALASRAASPSPWHAHMCSSRSAGKAEVVEGGDRRACCACCADPLTQAASQLVQMSQVTEEEAKELLREVLAQDPTLAQDIALCVLGGGFGGGRDAGGGPGLDQDVVLCVLRGGCEGGQGSFAAFDACRVRRFACFAPHLARAPLPLLRSPRRRWVEEAQMRIAISLEVDLEVREGALCSPVQHVDAVGTQGRGGDRTCVAEPPPADCAALRGPHNSSRGAGLPCGAPAKEALQPSVALTSSPNIWPYPCTGDGPAARHGRIAQAAGAGARQAAGAPSSRMGCRALGLEGWRVRRAVPGGRMGVGACHGGRRCVCARAPASALGAAGGGAARGSGGQRQAQVPRLCRAQRGERPTHACGCDPPPAATARRANTPRFVSCVACCACVPSP